MEVINENFETLLPKILEDVKSCSFLTADLEMSGLWRRNEPKCLDMPEDYYEKYLDSGSDFICMQIGLSFFKQDPDSKRYTCKSYSFYTFPHQFFRNSNYSFSCQASSIDFLVGHKFDFNKCFYHGIQYLNVNEETKLSEKLEEKRLIKEKNSSKEYENIDIPDEHKTTVDEACDKLEKLLDKDFSESEVRLAGHNGYVRRLIYQVIRERFPNGEILVDTRDGVMVGRKTPTDSQEIKTQIELDEETVSKAVGFSKIIRAITKHNKLVVGHNMFLDLCQIVNHFLCYLPPSYSEFKSVLRSSFPLILDTKYMSTSGGMQDLIPVTVLEKLLKRMSEVPFSLPDIVMCEGFSYPEDSENFHDGGYDSYVTGLCFLSLYNFLEKKSNPSGNAVFNPKSDKLSKFLNRIYMHNTPTAHLYVHGPDPIPDRSHYFHIKFPKQWQTSDISNLFSNYGRIFINWINDTSAWVSLYDTTQSSDCKQYLCSKSSRLPQGVVVLPYSQSVYKMSLLSIKRQTTDSGPVSSPLPKKRRSSRDSSFLSRSVIETILEDNEEDEDVSEANGSSNDATPKNEEVSVDKKRNRSGRKRKSNVFQVSTIAELENEMNVDSTSKSFFGGSSSW